VVATVWRGHWLTTKIAQVNDREAMMYQRKTRFARLNLNSWVKTDVRPIAQQHALRIRTTVGLNGGEPRINDARFPKNDTCDSAHQIGTLRSLGLSDLCIRDLFSGNQSSEELSTQRQLVFACRVIATIAIAHELPR
jgi:hypothetical protein